MEFTKKQRRDIYLKAAERILLCKSQTCCYALFYASGAYNVSDVEKWVIREFSEFKLFKPKKRPPFNLWFIGDEQNKNRINCLLLCAEMCN